MCSSDLPALTVTIGSNVITVNDPSIVANVFDVVYIATPISAGGLILSGFYQVYNPSGTGYQIYATDILGNPQYATSSITLGGLVPAFTTDGSSSFVTVTLANHTYSAGDTFPVLIPYVKGGVTLFGNYNIISVVPGVSFVIEANTVSNSVTTGYENNGKANFVYYIGIGPIPVGSGYGVGGYGAASQAPQGSTNQDPDPAVKQAKLDQQQIQKSTNQIATPLNQQGAEQN